jgi:hypothetical protein
MAVLKNYRALRISCWKYSAITRLIYLSSALVVQFLALILFLRESNRILLPLPLIVGTEIGISANLQV